MMDSGFGAGIRPLHEYRVRSVPSGEVLLTTNNRITANRIARSIPHPFIEVWISSQPAMTWLWRGPVARWQRGVPPVTREQLFAPYKERERDGNDVAIVQRLVA